MLLLVCGVCGTAWADEDWKLQLLSCPQEEPVTRASLAEALALELGPTTDSARYAVRVRLPCGDDTIAVVSVEDLAAHVESRVDLGGTAPNLWDRVIALVARQLLHDARRLEQTSAQVAASPSTVPPLEPVAPPLPEPAAKEPGPWGLRVALGTRLFPSRPTGLFGGGVEGAWRWARLGLWAEGTKVNTADARVNGVIAVAQLGAVPFRWRQALWQVGVGAFIEGGLAHSSTLAKLAGYHGTSANVPFGSASVRTELGFRPAARWAITLSLDAGYAIGLRVNVLTVPTTDLGGTFVLARLGVEF